MSLICVALLWAGNTAAQDLTEQAKGIMGRPDVARAFAHVEAHRDRILGEWRALTEINAPSGKERERAETIRQLLTTCKLDRIYFDNIRLTNTASNNANIALLAGIPAISTGTAPCDNEHALSEWCWIEPFYGGIKKLILLEVALAGAAGSGL